MPPRLKRVHHHPPGTAWRVRTRHAGGLRMMQGMLGAFKELDATVDAIEELKKARARARSRSTRRRPATSSSMRSIHR